MTRTLPSLLSILLTFAALGGCGDDGDPPPGDACTTSADCRGGLVCVDERCVVDTTRDAGPGDAGEARCDDGRDRCGAGSGATCCAPEQVCLDNACADDCGARLRCAGACCEAAQECVEDRCVVECADEANRCGDLGELCCSEGQACLGDACVTLGDACASTDECEIDEICLTAVMACVPRDAVEVCEFRPPVGEFSPRVGCQWRPPMVGIYASFDDVVMTPAVANLSDDNGDGVTDERDVPDVVFVSIDTQRDGCCSFRGVIRVVSGACNDDGSMETLATIPMPHADSSGGVAVGNLHPDDMADERAPEIVAFLGGGRTTDLTPRPFIGLVAFRRVTPDATVWEEMWRNVEAPSRSHAVAAGQPSIADVNGDGAPEVILGNVVLDGQTGELVWDGLVTVGPEAGIGHNAFLGPASTIADIDLDGVMEVIAGNTVYDGRDGREEWSFGYTSSNSVCSSAFACDGYNAVGNFDDDDEGEVVAVREGQVYVLNHDGTLLHRVDIPWDDCGTDPPPSLEPGRFNESGPPTVADFDGDGRPEIGTASADFYVVVDFDCTGDPLPDGCDSQDILWKVPNEDCSSRATGSSVFDFEGDGRAEVVYADERTFRIFDGRTGAILFEDDTHRSNTRMEMPIVVDVDNDGQAEVVVPEPNTSSPTLGGIEIWEDTDNNWVRTRRIWNQHTYHVTNVTEDGQIPRDEEENWLNSRLNNFRQNVQPGGLFDATDLIVESIELADCDPTVGATIAVTVGNQGAVGAAPGVPVHVVVTPDGAAAIDLGVMRTTRLLLPGGSETLRFLLPAGPGGFSFATFSVTATVDSDGVGGSRYNECDEDNNTLTTDAPFMVCDFG